MNITLDDNSPRIQYLAVTSNSTSSWAKGSTSSDPGIANYYKETFTATSSEGGRVSLEFNGSAIYIYGSKGPNHGRLSVKIDERDPIVKYDTVSPDRIYQTLLHAEEGLDASKEHTFTLTNLAIDTGNQTGSGPYVDIDYIVIQSPFTSRIFTTIVSSAPPRLFYDGVWTSESNPDGSAVHTTRRPNDIASLTFYGSALEVLGTLSSDHGAYNVSIDGVPKAIAYSGCAMNPVYTASLFSISGLEDTQHTMVITNLGGPNGNSVFDIHHVVVNSTIDPSTKSSRPISSSTYSGYKPTYTSSYKDPGADVSGFAGGIAAGGFLALLGICVVIWLVWLRLKRAHERTRREANGIDLVGEANRRESLGSDSSEYDPALVPAELPDPFPSSWDRRPERHTSEYTLIGHSRGPVSAESAPPRPQTRGSSGPSTRTDLKSAILAFLAADSQPRGQAHSGWSGWHRNATAGSLGGRQGDGGRWDGRGREEDGLDVMPPSYDLAVRGP